MTEKEGGAPTPRRTAPPSLSFQTAGNTDFPTGKEHAGSGTMCFTMMVTVVFILVVVVALLAALCFRQSKDIKSKEKILAKFIKENLEMKAEIQA